MRPGRCLAPCSSAKTNLTRTTSPRLKLVIRSVLWIVPKVRQHRVIPVVEHGQIGDSELVRQVVSQACLDGVPHVIPNGLVALCSGYPNAPPRLARHVDAEPRSRALDGRHQVSAYGITLAQIRKCVNVTRHFGLLIAAR